MKTKPTPCKCRAYAFPHRKAGGACEGELQRIHRELSTRSSVPSEWKKAEEVGVKPYGPL